MTGIEGQITAEILSLQRRADQLIAANAGTERLLATATAEADAARTADNGGSQRLDRQVQLLRLRRTQAVQEIQTLLDLIAARRSRYGIPTPRGGGEG